MFESGVRHGAERVLLVTTNSFVRQDGALVMGRGAAKTAMLKWPRLPYSLGKYIDHLGEYNVGIITDNNLSLHIGAFQVKYHFKDEADLDLIARSVAELTAITNKKPDWRFDMNFPGIGNGHKAYEDVAPLLDSLPDNVHVWTFK
jgi:hypothetical protein